MPGSKFSSFFSNGNGNKNKAQNWRSTSATLASEAPPSYEFATAPWRAEGTMWQDSIPQDGKQADWNSRKTYLQTPMWQDSIPQDGKQADWNSRKTYLQTPMKRETREDALQTLARYNLIIIIDNSLSMAEGNLWGEAKKAFAQLAQIACTYDEDGIDVYFMNSPRGQKSILVRNSRDIERLFDSISPASNVTLMGATLDEILRAYLADLERVCRIDPLLETSRIKPIKILVLTNGMPSDDPESPIAQAAGRLDQLNVPMDQVGIQFVQIGNDPEATRFLMELDDDLKENHGVTRDIVDTTPADLFNGKLGADVLIKILLGGINKRHDRKPNSHRK